MKILEVGKTYFFAWASKDTEYFLVTLFDERNELYYYLGEDGDFGKFCVGSHMHRLVMLPC